MITQELFRVLGSLRDEHGMSLLVVEQNAGMALSLADRAYVLETGNIVATGTGAELLADDTIKEAYLGVVELMSLFLERMVNGLADGSIYALLALALVVVFRSTGQLNFAQGEIGTMGAFVVSTLTLTGLSVWLSILLAMVVGFIWRRESNGWWSGRSNTATPARSSSR
jgi:ABC-type sugar transport system ATPase subunit